MLYARVERGEIVEGPMVLPRAWRNISGLDRASAEDLLKLGWLPVEETAVEPGAGEVATAPVTTIGGTKVTIAAGVRSMTTEEQAAAAAARRAAAYPPIGDQLDVLWKQFAKDRLDGKALIQDADDMLGTILAVKRDIPIPGRGDA